MIQNLNSADPNHLAALAQFQESLAGSVVEDVPEFEPTNILALDIAYSDDNYAAAGVIYDAKKKAQIAEFERKGSVKFPYIPNYFAYREVPPLLDLIKDIEVHYDVILFDGNGQIHPRRAGAACFLGIATQKPTIGLSKNPPKDLSYQLSEEKGARYDFDNEHGRGAVLRTSPNVKPVFVSVGNWVDLDFSCDVILSLSRFRVPEPLRIADQICRRSLGNAEY